MKVRVLHLIDNFELGGTERQAVQLIRLQKESGQCDVHVACFRNSGVLLQKVERLDVGVIPQFPLRSFFDLNFALQVRRFAALLIERKINVIHVHGFYTNIFGMAAAALAHVPVRIASKRETEGFHTRTAAQRWVERRAFQIAHAVIANADAVKQLLIRDGIPAEKVVTIHNGIDLERFKLKPLRTRAESLSALNLPNEPARRFVTIVANLEREVKDHLMFLRAASRVHAAIPEAAFVLAGEGRLKESLRSFAAKLGLESAVFFLGRCPIVPELLEISDVCVLSSRAEGFSNSILEYMAAARPVVATDVGGAREAIMEATTGYLVPSGDDVMMAERIISLLNEPERARRMGERGRAVVEDRFSCKAQLEQTQSLYARLLPRNNL